MVDEKLPAISVVIPMYNSEEYIEECLQSLLNQTLKNLEVIVVDDCSTDNSIAIVQKMIQPFSNNGSVLFIAQFNRNSGCPGIPRNAGIKLAKGKYIYFLDSDDFLDSTALEDFYNVAEEFKADVVHSEKSFVYHNAKTKERADSTQSGEFVKEPTLETFDIGKRIKDFINKRYLWWGCNKLFRREFVVNNNLQFPSTLMFEDSFFIFQCIVCAQNYVRVPFVSYHYRIREGSLSHNTPLTIKHFQTFLDTIYFFDLFMRSQNVFRKNPEYVYSTLDFFIKMFFDGTSNTVFTKTDLTLTEIYDLFYHDVFSVNPEKNAALASYLYVSTNLYSVLVKRMAEEITELKNLLKNK